MFPDTDITQGWGQWGTEGGAFASFAKRYLGPLEQFARTRFHLDSDLSHELTARFFARELERDAVSQGAIFRLYDSDKGRLRNLLARSFWRFCRDQLEHEQRRSALSALPDEAAVDDFELARLISRDLLNSLRAEVSKALDQDLDAQVFELKWPPDLNEPPAQTPEIMAELGLSRGQVRGSLRRLADHLTYALNRRLRQSGLDADSARDLLGDYWRILDQEDSQTG